jgi:hypothetical protein
MQLSPLNRLRIERGARHLHSLGPRAVAEFLIEIGRQHACMDGVLAQLRDYGQLSPSMIRTAGADRFPPAVWWVA